MNYSVPNAATNIYQDMKAWLKQIPKISELGCAINFCYLRYMTTTTKVVSASASRL